MKTILREILTSIQEEKPDQKQITQIQQAFELSEDVERLAMKRGMVGVREAIEEGCFPMDVYDVDFFSGLLMEDGYGDHQVCMDELFLAKYVNDQPDGWQAFIDYIYYRTASVIYSSQEFGMLSVHLCSLLPKEVQKSFEVGNFLRKSCFEEFEQKCSLSEPPCQDLKTTDAIASRERFEKLLQKMDSRAIQRMLRDVENANLGVALKGCHPEMARVVLENLSKRVRAMILEDMDFMGPLREADVKESMDSISDLIEKLESSGEIVFLEGGMK